jgi:hypothetical protein
MCHIDPAKGTKALIGFILYHRLAFAFITAFFLFASFPDSKLWNTPWRWRTLKRHWSPPRYQAGECPPLLLVFEVSLSILVTSIPSLRWVMVAEEMSTPSAVACIRNVSIRTHNSSPIIEAGFKLLHLPI